MKDKTNLLLTFVLEL